MSENTDGEVVAQDSAITEVQELEKLAQAYDSGVDVAEEPPKEPEPEPEVEAQEEETSVGAEVTEGEAPKVTKADKDSARLDKTWKQVNEEKDRIKADKEALEEERRELERQKANRTNEFKDSEGYTADDYRRTAKAWEQDGEYDRAEWAKKQADVVEKEAKDAQVNAEQEKFREEFQRNFDKAAEDNPDLNTRTSDLYTSVMQLMQDKPFLSSYPEGIVDAVEVVKMRGASKEADELKAKLSEAEKEIEEYKGKLSIGGSPPTDRLDGAKGFDDMSRTEREKALETIAEDFDRQGVSIFGR